MRGIRIDRLRRVQREPLEDDGVSGQFDYSPERVERLVAQGRAAARQAFDSPNAPDGSETAPLVGERNPP
jgi:hypothetical protein